MIDQLIYVEVPKGSEDQTNKGNVKGSTSSLYQQLCRLPWGGDAQRERKKPSHVQGHVNKAEEFWKGVQSIYLSFQAR